MSEERDPLGVTISGREIYDQIVGLRDDVQRLTHSNTAVDQVLADHEARIRAAERWRWSVPTALVGAVVSVGVTITKAIGG